MRSIYEQVILEDNDNEIRKFSISSPLDVVLQHIESSIVGVVASHPRNNSEYLVIYTWDINLANRWEGLPSPSNLLNRPI